MTAMTTTTTTAMVAAAIMTKTKTIATTNQIKSLQLIGLSSKITS
jgi:hypothetical protein